MKVSIIDITDGEIISIYSDELIKLLEEEISNHYKYGCQSPIMERVNFNTFNGAYSLIIDQRNKIKILEGEKAYLWDLLLEEGNILSKPVQKQLFNIAKNCDKNQSRSFKESDTAREILQMIDSIPTNEVNELNHLWLLKKAISEKYGVDLGE